MSKTNSFYKKNRRTGVCIMFHHVKYYQDIILFGLLLWLKAIVFRLIVLPPILMKGVFSDLLFSVIIVSLVTILTSRRVRKYVLYGINIIVSLIWFSASTYQNYYGSIPTYLTLTSLGQVGQIGESISASIQPIYYIFALDLLIILIIFVINKFRKRSSFTFINVSPRRSKVVLVSVIALVASLILSAGLIYQSKSIVNEKELARHLGLYHYQVAYALKSDKQVNTSTTLTEEERQQLMSQIKDMLAEQNQSEKAYTGVAAGTHVLTIQLEAFQNFLIGLEVNGQVITPFLNEFVQSNFYFDHVYQQIGEGNTSDAEFLANTGAYPQGDLAMSKLVGQKEVQSLPRLLKQHQYSTYTFHVNDVSFWNRNELYPALGFDKYYEKADFVNDEFNFFGASDEELYRVAFEQLQQKDEAGENFYAHLIATSGHHPFVIPEQFQTLQLPESLQGTQLGHYLQAAHYVDKQLGLFVAELEESGMLAQTTLVIYGDHFGLQQQDNPPEWVSEQLGIVYHDTLTRFNIPLIIAVPGVQGEHVSLTGGQVDIVPTVLNLLGITTDDTEMILFGEDLLNSETNTIGIRYYMPTGTFINEDVFYVPGDQFSTGTAIDRDTFQPITDLSSLEEDYNYIMEVMKASDRYTSNYRKVITD